MNQNFQPNHLFRSPRGLALVLAAALTLTVDTLAPLAPGELKLAPFSGHSVRNRAQ